MLTPYENLRQHITDAFSKNELKNACFDRSIEYDDLEGSNRPTKIISLIKLLGRTNRLGEFVEWAKHERQGFDWPEANWDTFDWLAEEPESAVVDPNIEPYKGLDYFHYSTEDIKRFFGRDELSSELTQKTLDHLKAADKADFLAITGASGSGKSSLMQAGILPKLMDKGNFQLHIITPTAKPLEKLTSSLTRESESVTAAATLTSDLQKEPRSLHLYARKLLSQQNQAADKLLLVIDQFEELFTLCGDEAKRKAFVDNLTTAVSPESGGSTVVLLTIRADFYHRFAPYDQLRELLDQQQKYIGNMDEEGLREAIEKPAVAAGYEFEAGLVEQILRDVGQEPGSLPLLSHALQETWQHREGLKFTLVGYLAAGGVRGAIAQTAEATYQSLTEKQQKIAQQIFLRLTELGEGTHDTRRRVNLEELNFEENAQDVTHQLADARLVTTNDEGVDVAHEALIREWPRLRNWLDQNRETVRIHRHLSVNAMTWKNENGDPSYLYRGARLEQTEEWLTNQQMHLSELEFAFLEASVEARQKELARIAEENRQEAYRMAQLRAMTETFSTVRSRVFFTFLGLTLAIIGIGLFIFFTAETGSVEEQLENQLLDAGQTVAELMVEHEEDRLEVLRAISFTEDVPQAVRESDEGRIAELVPQIVRNNDQDMVVVINLDGNELIGMQRIPRSEFIITSGADYSAFEDVQLVLDGFVDLTGDKRAFLAQTPSTGIVVLITVGPIYDEGKLVGAVLVGSDVNEFARSLTAGANARVTLYDQNGGIVASTIRPFDSGGNQQADYSVDEILGPFAPLLPEIIENAGGDVNEKNVDSSINSSENDSADPTRLSDNDAGETLPTPSDNIPSNNPVDSTKALENLTRENNAGSSANLTSASSYVGEDPAFYNEILNQLRETEESLNVIVSGERDISDRTYLMAFGDWRVRNQSYGLYSVAVPSGLLSTERVSRSLLGMLFVALAILLSIFGFTLARSTQRILISEAAKLDQGAIDD